MSHVMSNWFYTWHNGSRWIYKLLQEDSGTELLETQGRSNGKKKKKMTNAQTILHNMPMTENGWIFLLLLLPLLLSRMQMREMLSLY